MSRIALLGVVLIAAVGCESNVCSGVDGTCVAVTVAGEGTVDGVEMLFSGAASGTQVAPPEARAQSLPITVPLQLTDASSGTLHVGVVGVYLGDVVGRGNGDVEIVAGSHAALTVTITPDGTVGGDGGPQEPVDVTGTRVRHFVLGDGGVVDVPTDFTSVPIGALVPTEGGVAAIAGTGDANGNFTLRKVTAPYFLKFENSYVFGDASHPDLGEWFLGRPDQKWATSTTNLQLSVTGLEPWATGDTLQLFSLNAGLVYFGVEDIVPPATGATTLSGSIDLSQAAYGALIDADKGDEVFLAQLVAEGDGGVPYQRLAKVAWFPPFTLPNGGSQTASAAMTDVPASSTLPIVWARSQFAQYMTAVNPGATAGSDDVYLFAQPGGLAHGFVGSTPDLAIAKPPAGTSDVTLTMSYGNPYPPAWPLVLSAESNFEVSFTAPGASPQTFNGAISTFAPAASAPSPIVPAISPVQAPTIDGMDAMTAQASASPTPVVSWKAPAVGTPSGYTVTIWSITNRGNETAFDGVATFYTKLTSVTIPPGLLAAGTSYFLQITAWADAIDRSVTPYLAALPTAWADALTAPITIGTVALGASCKDLLAKHPGLPDGIYTIDVDGPGAAPANAVLCDMTTAGGGWTLCAWSRSSSAETAGWAPVSAAQSSNWYACHKYSATPVEVLARLSGTTGTYTPQFADVDLRPGSGAVTFTSTSSSPALQLSIEPNTAACGASSPGNFQWTINGTPGEVIFGLTPKCTCGNCQTKDYFSFVRSSGVNSNGCSGPNQIPPEIGYPCGGYGNYGVHMELWAR